MRKRLLVMMALLSGTIMTSSADARVPLPPVMPELKLASCPGRQEPACTWPGGPIYWDVKRTNVHALWHEFGHQFDYQAMYDPQRDKFRALIDDARPWRSSPNSPHEQFAEAYALCALGARTFKGYVEGAYTYNVTRRRHARICVLIRNAGIIARKQPAAP